VTSVKSPSPEPRDCWIDGRKRNGTDTECPKPAACNVKKARVLRQAHWRLASKRNILINLLFQKFDSLQLLGPNNVVEWLGYDSSFVFGRSWFQISVLRWAILTAVFRYFPQSLQANTRIVPNNRPRLFPSTYFTINYSIILSFDALWFELLKASLNKEQKTTGTLLIDTVSAKCGRHFYLTLWGRS
jgi:hypothetical protein